jgi:hypothetical protein
MVPDPPGQKDDPDAVPSRRNALADKIRNTRGTIILAPHAHRLTTATSTAQSRTSPRAPRERRPRTGQTPGRLADSGGRLHPLGSNVGPDGTCCGTTAAPATSRTGPSQLRQHHGMEGQGKPADPSGPPITGGPAACGVSTAAIFSCRRHSGIIPSTGHSRRRSARSRAKNRITLSNQRRSAPAHIEPPVCMPTRACQNDERPAQIWAIGVTADARSRRRKDVRAHILYRHASSIGMPASLPAPACLPGRAVAMTF